MGAAGMPTCETMKCEAPKFAASSLVGMSDWKEPSRKSKPPLSSGTMEPSAALVRRWDGRITPGSAHEAATADDTSTLGALMWLRSRVEPRLVVDVERLTHRPVRAKASANVKSPQRGRSTWGKGGGERRGALGGA